MPATPADYNANIPQASDQLSVSQGDLLNNFGAIQALIDVNHVDFAAGQAGKHFFVEFPVQSSAPTTIANEVGLYCQNSTYTSQPELVFSHQLGSTAPTGAKIVEFTSAGWTANGWSRIPSGILFKWGTSTANGNTSISFPTGATIPVFNQIFACFITSCPTSGTTDSNQYVALNSYSTTGIVVYGGTRTVVSSPQSASFQYLAIGV